MKAKAKECQNCVHWVQYVDGKGAPIYGECRRFPPTSQRVPTQRERDMFPAFYEIVTNWPRLKITDWCDEFNPSK